MPAQVAGVLELAEAAAAADRCAPLSEHVLLHLRYDGAGPGPRDHAGCGLDLGAVTVDGEIAGYAYLDPPEPEVSGELVVHPAAGGRASARPWSAT